MHLHSVGAGTPGYKFVDPGLITARAVGTHLTQLFIFPVGLVDEWVPGETWGG